MAKRQRPVSDLEIEQELSAKIRRLDVEVEAGLMAPTNISSINPPVTASGAIRSSSSSASRSSTERNGITSSFPQENLGTVHAPARADNVGWGVVLDTQRSSSSAHGIKDVSMNDSAANIPESCTDGFLDASDDTELAIPTKRILPPLQSVVPTQPYHNLAIMPYKPPEEIINIPRIEFSTSS